MHIPGIYNIVFLINLGKLLDMIVESCALCPILSDGTCTFGYNKKSHVQGVSDHSCPSVVVVGIILNWLKSTIMSLHQSAKLLITETVFICMCPKLSK